MSKRSRRLQTKTIRTEPLQTPEEPAVRVSLAAYAVAGVLLLVPCFWQPRLQAGDLSSHVYNAWLAHLIQGGQAPGLTIASQTTNVLFDLVLKALFDAFGPGAAQRIAVSASVLVFAAGAFAFVSKIWQRAAWYALPWIAILAYGWVFHVGFFNFYLSLGICFWALAIGWDLEPRKLAAGAGLLVLAYLAHALPVLWTAGVMAYLSLARRFGHRVLIASLCGVVLLRVALSQGMQTLWSANQIPLITGFDQAWVFDSKYLLVSIAALGICVIWILRGVEFRKSVIFQVWLLTAAGIAILPGAVLIPGYKHSLAFISERMSLAAAVCLLAWAGKRIRARDRYVSIPAAAIFFVLLFLDGRKLNALEDRMDAAVAQLPPMQRVISGIDLPGTRINAVTHMIDRVCVGRCYSYANYEPSTAQFRVRVNGESGIVAATYGDSFALQTGQYVVKKRDLPLYQLLIDERSEIQVRTPPVGQACGMTAWNGF